MTSEGEWRMRVGAGVALGILLGASWAAFPSSINWKGVEWATWYQTAVAVCAIYFGFLGIRWQSQRNDRAKRDERLELQRELLVVCCAVASSAVGAITSSGQKILDRHRFIPTDRLDDVLVSLQNLMARDVPVLAVGPLMVISSQIAYEISAIKLIGKGKNSVEAAQRGALQRRDLAIASAGSLNILRNSDLLEQANRCKT